MEKVKVIVITNNRTYKTQGVLITRNTFVTNLSIYMHFLYLRYEVYCHKIIEHLSKSCIGYPPEEKQEFPTVVVVY